MTFAIVTVGVLLGAASVAVIRNYDKVDAKYILLLIATMTVYSALMEQG